MTLIRAARDAVEIRIGDCRDLLAAMPEASVDCIVTSPPYFCLRDYGCDGQIGLEPSPAEFIAAMVDVFRRARRVLKPTGTAWINLGDSYAGAGKTGGGAQGERLGAGGAGAASPNGKGSWASPKGWGVKVKDLMMIPARVAIALCDDGWWLRSDIIWAKKNPMPESVSDRPTKAHEHVFLLAKSQRYWYDAAAIKETATNRAPGSKASDKHIAVALTDPKARTKANLHLIGAVEDRNARTVWVIPTEACDIAHFALMPTELARRCILAGCPKGGVVLDPFGGGGTTGLVAARHGRRAILCELNAGYAAIARDRINREWREQPTRMHVDAGPLFAGVAE